MTEETQALTRYALHFHYGDDDAWMVTADDGEFVRYDAAAAALTSLARDLETARQERDAALAEIAETRRVLWLAHRHHGIYGDDGEMQCGECAGNPPGERGMDYRRDPLPLSAISAARSLQRQTDAAVRAARAETLRELRAEIAEAKTGLYGEVSGVRALEIIDAKLAAREGQ